MPVDSGLIGIILPPTYNVYSFISYLNRPESILLIDCECEYNHTKDNVNLLEVRPEDLSKVLLSEIKEKIIIVNTIYTHKCILPEIQNRLNLLWKHIYNGKTVYYTLKNYKQDKKLSYLIRMSVLYNLSYLK
ncbi:hypothetical protein NEOKW01_2025 [Nematocida sp. AWRm80]|nr:hypothetical protein NEOKW01_2025 [Nematocida sp. AWRm80]